jgi:hypothetical protein
MIGALILVCCLFVVSQPIVNKLAAKNKKIQVNLIRNLFWYHMFFGLVYYTYTLFNRSDAIRYYQMASNHWGSWHDAFFTGTGFIEWLAYPWANFLFFNFEMSMVVFTWMGFWGFVCFYVFFKEQLRTTPRLFGYDLLTIILFLPNMHFWTASIGKGAVIFFGIGMFMYGLSAPAKRWAALAAGGFFIYMVRPHILFAILLGMGVGYVLGREKTALYKKYLVAAVGIVLSFYLYSDVINYLGYDPENFIESFEDQNVHIARELQYSAGSGVNMGGYSLPMKLFTFWFRPLFVDSPNVLGLAVSFENVLYLFLFLTLFRKDFLRYIVIAPAMVKMAGLVFVSVSISMTYMMSNLGIIIRQKSQIMYFMLFVVLAFMDWKKVEAYKQYLVKARRLQLRKEKLKSV